MTTRAQSLLILAGTLIVGIAIGALATGAIFNARMDTLRALRSPGGMQERILAVIQPESPQQAEQIQTILSDTEKRLRELRRAQSRPFRAVIDSMHLQMQPVLSAEQWERLETWREQDRKHWRKGPPGRHKGQPGERRRGRGER